MNSPQRQASGAPLIAAWGLACLPAVALYVLLTPLAVNIPIWDDYDAALDFLNHLLQLPTAGSKWAYALTAQHTQYKLYFVNGLVWLQQSLFGSFDFRWAGLASNLLLLPIAWLLWKLLLPASVDRFRKVIFFIPISCIWFQLNYAETVDWAVSAYQTLPVLIAVLAGIILLVRQTRAATAWALLCVVAAIFSSGSGFVFPLVAGVLLLRRRRFAAFAAVMAVTAACAAVYAIHYTVLQLGASHPLPFFAQNARRLLFAVVFLGDGLGKLYPALVLGGAQCAFWIWMLRRGYFRRRPDVGYLVLFIGLVALLVAFGRAEGGVKVALLSRYRLYSDLLLAFTWIACTEEFLSKRPWPAVRFRVRAAIAAAVLFAIAMDLHGVQFITKRNAWLRSGLLAWQQRSPGGPSPNVVLPEPGQPPQDAERDAWDRHATVVLEESIRLGVYRPPKL